VQQKIIGYHQDELGDWVAELACCHGQHVRHKPPFINRPWVISIKGREQKLGAFLNCRRCDYGEEANELIRAKHQSKTK